MAPFKLSAAKALTLTRGPGGGWQMFSLCSRKAALGKALAPGTYGQ